MRDSGNQRLKYFSEKTVVKRGLCNYVTSVNDGTQLGVI